MTGQITSSQKWKDHRVLHGEGAKAVTISTSVYTAANSQKTKPLKSILIAYNAKAIFACRVLMAYIMEL